MKYKTNGTTCGKRRGKRWKLVCRWAPARGLAVGSNRKSMFTQPSPSPEHPLLTLLSASPSVSEEDGKPDSLECLKNELKRHAQISFQLRCNCKKRARLFFLQQQYNFLIHA